MLGCGLLLRRAKVLLGLSWSFECNQGYLGGGTNAPREDAAQSDVDIKVLVPFGIESVTFGVYPLGGVKPKRRSCMAWV